MYFFFYDLAPWKNDDMPLRRFLAASGDNLKDKHPDICEAFCRELMDAISGSAVSTNQRQKN